MQMVRQAHQVGLDHLPAHLNRVKAFQHEPLPENIRSQILHRLAFLGYIVLIWPRPLRFQGRFASKAASLPRQNQTEINHEDHEEHEVFLFILHGLHVLHG
jgi:hypothetical protein